MHLIREENSLLIKIFVVSNRVSLFADNTIRAMYAMHAMSVMFVMCVMCAYVCDLWIPIVVMPYVSHNWSLNIICFWFIHHLIALSMHIIRDNLWIKRKCFTLNRVIELDTLSEGMSPMLPNAGNGDKPLDSFLDNEKKKIEIS